MTQDLEIHARKDDDSEGLNWARIAGITMAIAVHAAALNFVHALVDVNARSVELGGVHVHDKRPPGQARDGQASRVGQPVMGVDDIEFQVPGGGNDESVACRVFGTAMIIALENRQTIQSATSAKGQSRRAMTVTRCPF